MRVISHDIYAEVGEFDPATGNLTTFDRDSAPNGGQPLRGPRWAIIPGGFFNPQAGSVGARWSAGSSGRMCGARRSVGQASKSTVDSSVVGSSSADPRARRGSTPRTCSGKNAGPDREKPLSEYGYLI
jgi:hypothetical protein